MSYYFLIGLLTVFVIICVLLYKYIKSTDVDFNDQEGFNSKNHTRYNNSIIFLPQLLLSADPYVRTKIKRICNNPMFNPREYSLTCKKQPCIT